MNYDASFNYGLGYCPWDGRLTTFLTKGLWIDYNTFFYDSFNHLWYCMYVSIQHKLHAFGACNERVRSKYIK